MKNFSGIHPTATIGDNVTLGRNVTIGPRTIIYDNVAIGDGTKVGADVILGEPLNAIYSDLSGYRNPPLIIGAGAIIRSGTIIYAGCTIGERLETGHRATIRENSVIGTNLRTGTLSDIQGNCSIGDYVRLHSNVFVAQSARLENFVWMFPHSVLTDDPHPPSNEHIGVIVEEFAAIAATAVILPGVRVGRDSLVGAGSVVRHNVAPEVVVAGNPAKQLATIHDLKNRRTGEKVYPWRYHFDRGMPWEGIGYDTWAAQSNR